MTRYDGTLDVVEREELEPGPDVPPQPGRFRSQWGGLWTDLDHAHAIVDGKRELGWIDDTDVTRLRHWIDQGFVILEGVVEPEVTEGLLEALGRTLNGELPARRAEWWSEGVKYVDVAGPTTMDETAAKLLDLYMTSEAARAASLHPEIVRFLSLVFERPPMAFQSLTMKRGTQQPVHTDTTFVRVSAPLEMVASWVALEDVAEGAGELEYYPGSHRVAELLFGGELKWCPEEATSLPDYSTRLHEHAKANGLSMERFRPKRGDVLLWSADLFHGGAAEIEGDLTRRSHVTHYCPVDRAPMYLYRNPAGERHRHPSGAYWCGDPG